MRIRVSAAGDGVRLMDERIMEMLIKRGADIVRFVDISTLPADQTQGFPRAIVFCLALTRGFILAMRNGENTDGDEFVDKEHQADGMADCLAEYIRQQGYRAYSQSEESNSRSGNFDEKTHTSRLPHKTIARHAGLGYIGKNNLLITEEYGCAFSMCTVLTDAPLIVGRYPLVASRCGDCDQCRSVCPDQAIYGNEWSESTMREGVVDVYKCKCPLKCVVFCPQTMDYVMRSTETG